MNDTHDDSPCKLTQSNESLADRLAESVTLNTSGNTSVATNPSLVGTLVDALPPQSVVGEQTYHGDAIDVSMRSAREMAQYYEAPVDLSSGAGSGASSGTTPPHPTGGGKSRKTHKHSQQGHRYGAGQAGGHGAAMGRYSTHNSMTEGDVAGRGRQEEYMLKPPPLTYHGEGMFQRKYTVNNNTLEQQHTRMYL